MDFIPTFHFIISLIIFGLLFYVYNPIIIYLRAEFPTVAGFEIYAAALFFMWGVLAGVNLLASGIRLIMKMQEQRV